MHTHTEVKNPLHFDPISSLLNVHSTSASPFRCLDFFASAYSATCDQGKKCDAPQANHRSSSLYYAIRIFFLSSSSIRKSALEQETKRRGTRNDNSHGESIRCHVTSSCRQKARVSGPTFRRRSTLSPLPSANHDDVYSATVYVWFTRFAAANEGSFINGPNTTARTRAPVIKACLVWPGLAWPSLA